MRIVEVKFVDQTSRSIFCKVKLEKKKLLFGKKEIIEDMFFLNCDLNKDGVYRYGYIPISSETGKDAGISIYEALQERMIQAHQQTIKKIAP